MKQTQVLVDGRSLTLERIIGRGGEGEVYAVSGDPEHVIKLYTTNDRASREDKIVAMVRCELAKRTPLIAFPIAVVRSKDGSFGGFMMKLMGGYRPLHEIYAPGPRKHHFPQADYRFLARTAANIARAFASVHASGCVVGDINHSGILVSDKATAALIDADSFQFADGNQHFLCRVGVPEYTPPELQGKPLSNVVRTHNHDAFGLAVVVFQMLMMGRHPFVGTVRKGETPQIHENIANFRYVYADNRNVGMDQPPGTPSLSDFSPEIAGMFDRAFSKGSANSRPSAQDWVQALDRFETALAQCPDNALHFAPKDASECAWCEMERQLGVVLFEPYYPRGREQQRAIDPGGAQFNLEAIWSAIERVRPPSRAQVQPRLPVLELSASEKAQAALRQKGKSQVGWGIVLIVCGGAMLITAPSTWIFALVLIFWGASACVAKEKAKIDGRPLTSAFVDAQNQWYRELDSWHRRIGMDDLEDLHEQLRAARRDYLALSSNEERQIKEYRAKRHERQLLAFLDGFNIELSDVKGIGPAKIATLASYGITTAADVSHSRLAAVRGFGEVTIGRLQEWRSKLERRFVFNANENAADRQELDRIRAATAASAGPLRATLASGAREFEKLARHVSDTAKREDSSLLAVHRRLEQARQDLTFLTLPIPNVPVPPRTQRKPAQPASPVSRTTGQPQRTSQPPIAVIVQPIVRQIPAGNTGQHTSTTPPATRNVPPPRPPASASVPTCPRCGSSMAKRLARRGRNAGKHFWGCSRYPACKGTRDI